ncbi:hypothetical protein ACIQRK_15950 [Streptomyces anulatus]
MPRRAERGAAALVLGLLLLAGCNAEPVDGGGDGERRTPKPAATSTLEQLAAEAGCDPNVQTDAAELRLASVERFLRDVRRMGLL